MIEELIKLKHDARQHLDIKGISARYGKIATAIWSKGLSDVNLDFLKKAIACGNTLRGLFLKHSPYNPEATTYNELNCCYSQIVTDISTLKNFFRRVKRWQRGYRTFDINGFISPSSRQYIRENTWHNSAGNASYFTGTVVAPFHLSGALPIGTSWYNNSIQNNDNRVDYTATDVRTDYAPRTIEVNIDPSLWSPIPSINPYALYDGF